jgi:predicted DNA-binding helix-hairpin-helix protein
VARLASLEERVDFLMSLAGDDRESDSNVQLPPRLRHAKDVGALRPLNFRNVRAGRGRVTLMRVLMTNACTFNCHYCPMRRDRNMPRTLLKPNELVRMFLDARARGWCEGLFLTTAIPGRPIKVMDDLIEVLELLRIQHRYDGYIHVKILPGAEHAQVERITSLATRVSVNLEAPCGDHLVRIAPDKNLASALTTLGQAHAIVRREQLENRDGKRRDRFQPNGGSGMTTQFVVGATPDNDRAIVTAADRLYAAGGMHHVHFSAFRPIRETPMEQQRATPALREHRLYQTDSLLREYGFDRSEIIYDAAGNLPLDSDPKTQWAIANPTHFPVEVTTASYEALVRVPGIGVHTARTVVEHRRSSILRDATDLRKLGVQLTKAAGFLSVHGRKLGAKWGEQLGLWSPAENVGGHDRTYDVSPGTFR